MKLRRVMLATAALVVSASAAVADCEAELAQLSGGVAKDGTMAPLSGEATATPQTGEGAAAEATAGEGIAKDGSETPLTADPGIATSAQDVEAQQQGGATAAEQAMGEAGGAELEGRDAAIARAHEALAAGDEAGCMSAVEEAKGM
jgi:hypothetical protein